MNLATFRDRGVGEPRTVSFHLSFAALGLLLPPVLAAAPAQAQVTPVDGFWSTSFVGCETPALGLGDVCDGLTAMDVGLTCGASPVLHSNIDVSANFPDGEGGAGFALYYEGNSRNTFSSGLLLTFDPPEPDVWVRFYRSWPVGQTWGGILEHKIFYIFSDAGMAANVNFPQGEDDIGLQPRGTMGSPDIYVQGNGWQTLNGGSLVGDGAWHAFEFHFRLGTPGADDGLFEMWIDGVNVAVREGLDFYDGGNISPSGWSEIELPSNHNVSTLAGCGESRLDDIAVATPSYVGFVRDAQNRPMIGPLASACPDCCGNGVFDAAERCDPAIASGAGACPASCDDADSCTTDVAAGSASACSASCVHTAVSACADADGCCPSGCTNDVDDDCTQAPEDDAGVLGPDAGEGDAGFPSDAGEASNDAGPDAGSPSDGGPPAGDAGGPSDDDDEPDGKVPAPPSATSGCGCMAENGASPLEALLLAFAAWRVRRRPSASGRCVSSTT